MCMILGSGERIEGRSALQVPAYGGEEERRAEDDGKEQDNRRTGSDIPFETEEHAEHPAERADDRSSTRLHSSHA